MAATHVDTNNGRASEIKYLWRCFLALRLASSCAIRRLLPECGLVGGDLDRDRGGDGCGGGRGRAGIATLASAPVGDGGGRYESIWMLCCRW
jgi:hypothetical protein